MTKEELEKENADLKMGLKWDADNRDELLKENARMRELLKTLNESVVMTADDVFWSLKEDVEKFFGGEEYEEHQTEEM